METCFQVVFAMDYEGIDLDLSWLDWLTIALVIVGALNWGLVGVGAYFDQSWNLVDLLFGWAPAIENLVYVVVGLAGLYGLYFAWQLRDAESESERAEVERTA